MSCTFDSVVWLGRGFDSGNGFTPIHDRSTRPNQRGKKKMRVANSLSFSYRCHELFYSPTSSTFQPVQSWWESMKLRGRGRSTCKVEGHWQKRALLSFLRKACQFLHLFCRFYEFSVFSSLRLAAAGTMMLIRLLDLKGQEQWVWAVHGQGIV